MHLRHLPGDRPIGRTLGRFALSAAALSSVVLAIDAPASASVDEPRDAGDLTIVSALDGAEVLVNGDSSTFWTIQLPEDATCPGDSANDQWRTQSFLLPDGVDPVDQVYGPIGPEPWDNGERFSLFKADTEPYVHEVLEKNPAPGQPGNVLPIPTMNFEVLAAQQIPTGTYRLGIACTYFNETAKWWDIGIVVERVEGAPERFTWRLIDAPSYEPPQNTQGWLAIGAIAAALALAVAFIVFRHRGAPTHPSTLVAGPAVGAPLHDPSDSLTRERP